MKHAVASINMSLICSVLLGAALGLLSATQPAFAQSGGVSREEFLKVVGELQKQNRELAQEVKELKKEKAARESALTQRVQQLEQKQPAGDAASVAQVKQQVDEMETVIQSVEKKALTDRVNFAAELRTRIDWFDYKDERNHKSDSINAAPSNRFRLNLTSQVSDNLKLIGRLTMYKRWQDNNEMSTGGFNSARAPGDSDLEVERIYAEYYFKPNEKLPMTLTFGRLPQTDSLPTNLREDTPRKSTYPGLAYDLEADGIALAVSLAEIIKLPDATFRIMYNRAVDQEDDYDSAYRQPQYHMDDSNTYSFQFETGLTGFMRNSLFIANYIYVDDFQTADLTNETANGLPFKVVDFPGSSGDAHKFTLFLMSERFFDSPFDWFAGYSYMLTKGTGVARYQVGPIKIPGLGLLSDHKRDTNSCAFHVGTRYALPWKVLNGSKFGVEYNYGSKYWMGFNDASEDPLHKLNVNGHAWDFYYLQPITKNFNLRFGYTLLENKYFNQYIGEVQGINENISNTYVLLDAKFF
jgi:hypothetical protein